MKRKNQQVEKNVSDTTTITTTSTGKINDTIEAPNYGSQEYWEKRYKRNHFNISNGDKQQQQQQQQEEEEEQKEEVSPGHEWYFNYEELRSLILPLILGGRDEQFDQWSDDDDDDGDDDDDCDGGDDDDDDSSNQNTDNDDDGNYYDWEKVENHSEEVENDSDDKADKYSDNKCNGLIEDNKEQKREESKINDDTTGVDNQKYLIEDNSNYESIYKTNYRNKEKRNNDDVIAQQQPKKILEIGCGDVPLGRDICNDLLQFQSITGGVNAKLVVEQIICFDYSRTVIELLIKQEQTHNYAMKNKEIEKDDGDNNNHTDLNVTYEVLDARKLPFQDKKFDLVLDKGTLDAMLSDKEKGINNCVEIVSEAARTLACGGYLMIVSHLNACNAKGLSWVDEVLMAGLRKGDQRCDWKIEVHSSEEEDENSNFDNELTQDEDVGPAVYIIRKVAWTDESRKHTSKVSIKFFGY